MLVARPAWGAEKVGDDPGTNNAPRDHYRAHELSVDVFGTGSIGKYTINHPSTSRIRQDGELGAGLGVSYFFNRHLGVGADVYSENTTSAFIDSASANLILRLPLGESGFAPYAFGGGGRQFDRIEAWFGQFGAGMEYRFTPHVGVFLDARLVVPEETKCYGLARLGLRIAF